MSENTENLAREAESRRSNVESTIEDLRSRMSVGQIVDELSGYMKQGQAGAMAENLGRQVRDNPLALGLVGAGIAWLMMGDGIREGTRRVTDRYRDDGHDDDGDDVALRMSGGASAAGRPTPTGTFGDGSADARLPAGSAATQGDGSSTGMTDRLKGAASAASSGLSSMSGRAGSAASSAAQGARRLGHDAADAMTSVERAAMRHAQSVGRGARRLGASARRTVVDTLQEEPLVIGAIALAIGAAIGASLPSTRIEDEYLGEAGDSLREQAKGYGKDALESGKRVAERAYQAASETAEEKGLKPRSDGESLSEKIAGVASAAKETAKSEAQKEGLV